VVASAEVVQAAGVEAAEASAEVVQAAGDGQIPRVMSEMSRIQLGIRRLSQASA